MGSHGPVPDRRLQALKGEGRSRDYPRAVVTAPPKPPDLEPDAERSWDVIVPELERLRLVSRLDGCTMEALCATYARWKRHNGGHGYAALTNVLAKLARDVGLGPAARQRMAARASDPGGERAVFERAVFGGN
jgi:phage terminase small subunit